MKAIRFLAASALASLFVVGCAANTDSTVEETDGTSEAVSSSKQLVGNWDADTGPVYHVQFTNDYAETLGGGLKGHRFEATIDNGIRCIKAPCPSDDKVAGVYAVKGTKLTLASFDKPTATFAKYLGDYTFHVTSTKLSLTKKDGTVSGTFHRAPAGIPCGDNVCTGTDYCCNPVMSICAHRGMMCIQ